MSGSISGWGYVPVRLVLGGIGSLFLVGPIIGWQIPTAAEAGGGACLVVAVLPKLPARLPFPGTKDGLWLGSKRDLAYNDFVRIEWGRLRPLAAFLAGDEWKDVVGRALEECYLNWGQLSEAERDRYAMQRIVAHAKGRFGLLPPSVASKGVQWNAILGADSVAGLDTNARIGLQELTVSERACLALAVAYGLGAEQVSAITGDPAAKVGEIVDKATLILQRGSRDPSKK